nr:MAG TPA: LexA repressor [Caudoviricetes sp.]
MKNKTETIKRGEKVRGNILIFITEYIKEHGYAPTFREIGMGVNLKSTASVSNHIEKMIKAGVLETDAGVGSPRALRIPESLETQNESRG